LRFAREALAWGRGLAHARLVAIALARHEAAPTAKAIIRRRAAFGGQQETAAIATMLAG
jgi:hypothetical protein